jgi:hypothetical protein
MPDPDPQTQIPRHSISTKIQANDWWYKSYNGVSQNPTKSTRIRLEKHAQLTSKLPFNAQWIWLERAPPKSVD